MLRLFRPTSLLIRTANVRRFCAINKNQHLQTLGLPSTASSDQIREAFSKKQQEFKQGTLNEQNFKQFESAFQALTVDIVAETNEPDAKRTSVEAHSSMKRVLQIEEANQDLKKYTFYLIAIAVFLVIFEGVHNWFPWEREMKIQYGEHYPALLEEYHENRERRREILKKIHVKTEKA